MPQVGQLPDRLAANHQAGAMLRQILRELHELGTNGLGALSLYLFLVTVADGSGLSYYSDQGICQLLPLDATALAAARRELLAAGLIAYQKPLYQVLALDSPAADGPRPAFGQPVSLGRILRGMERAP